MVCGGTVDLLIHHRIRADLLMNWNVESRIVRRWVEFRKLIVAGANNNGKVSFKLLDCSHSSHIFLTVAVTSWHAFSYILHSKKK